MSEIPNCTKAIRVNFKATYGLTRTGEEKPKRRALVVHESMTIPAGRVQFANQISYAAYILCGLEAEQRGDYLFEPEMVEILSSRTVEERVCPKSQ